MSPTNKVEVTNVTLSEGQSFFADQTTSSNATLTTVTPLSTPPMLSSPSVLYQYFALLSYFMGSSNATKCYGNLGCLHLTEDWYGLHRPVNVLPLERHIINTRFVLTTRESSLRSFLNLSQPLSISSSLFRGARPTKIIIHGFIDTGFVPWISEMTKLFVQREDVNVIVVDWGGGSSGLYSQTAANTRLVGLEVAALIDYLIEYKGAGIQDFHIIGHSLGAHIAGYAGEKLLNSRNAKLGRITALDPAQPLFQGMPEFVRLDAGDADFVDVIHTDAKSFLMGGYGMEAACGHIDFYPNGGFDQPGCSLFDMPVSLDSIDSTAVADTVGRHLVACGHTRAIELYMESLRNNDQCQLVAHRCDSYEDFEQGQCFDCGLVGENCAFLGERAVEYKMFLSNSSSSKQFKEEFKFYLRTAKKSPFCQHHYLLEFNLAQPADAEKWVQGFLKVNLYGTKSEITDVDLTPDLGSLTHGDGHKFWVLSNHAVDSIISVEAFWLYHGQSFCFWHCHDHNLHVKNVTVVTRRNSSLANDYYDNNMLKESLRLTHGKAKAFVLAFSRNLGTVRLVNVQWRYDHDIDPLDPLKVCVLLLCSDAFYMDSLAINSISEAQDEAATDGVKMSRNQPKVERTVVCGDSEDGFSTIKSGSWKLFYKEC